MFDGGHSADGSSAGVTVVTAGNNGTDAARHARGLLQTVQWLQLLFFPRREQLSVEELHIVNLLSRVR